ncbi:MAG: hypothetical protein V3T05_06850, partial [Myxococcota bacterium]
MRAATAFVVIAFATTGARAAPCHWDETGMPPLREHDGAVHILRQYTCPHDAQGALRIEVTATAGTNTVTAKEIKTEVAPKGKWLRTKKLSERLKLPTPNQAGRGRSYRFTGPR